MIKKSAVDLTDLAVGIMILGIVVSVGASIFLKYQDNRLTELDTFATTNETLLATDGGDTLNNVWVKEVTKIGNFTSGATVPTSNYTVNIDSDNGIGTITFAGSSGYNGSNVKVTYTSYNTSSPEYALAGDAASGLGEYGNWFDILVIVGIAALILSIIFLAFGREQGNMGVSY